MRTMKTKTLTSPRTSSSKQINTLSLSGLNSYKIDTSSLQQKARQIQMLKTQLQTQISQYKATQISYHQQTSKLIQQNKQLKGKIKKLQTELNQIKFDRNSMQKTKNIQEKDSSHLQIKINELQDKIQKLQNKLKKQAEYVSELEQYKKMYEIEVENKNNIMNFYETKLQGFKKDKMTLISKYQQKISILGSGLQMNTTFIPKQTTMNNKNNMRSSQNIKRQDSRQQMPRSLKPKDQTANQYKTLKQTNKNNISQSQKSLNSSRNIKFIKNPRNKISKNETQQQTPYKLLKIQSHNQLKYNTPKNNNQKPKNKEPNIYQQRNQVNDISVSSSSTKNNYYFENKISNNKNNLSSNKALTSSKTAKGDSSFLNLVKQIFQNLRRQSLKSQNLKNFNSIRNFSNLTNPSEQETIVLFHSFPFAPVDLDDNQFHEVIEYIKKHLLKKYSSWTGSLIIETIIDKIQDFQIAYEVNSQDQGQIIAGLSSNDDDTI